ncbi:hypothetical protein H9X83_04740 [Anaerotignum lactatifermentans]|uniref:Uncharacterized protein n=1 Tax=Anaerotignum lactatifermentans TaxID=160404 RepID=A0ABS2G8E4_9FIRM|nr:hypothetical protein [Anaerotignum lactatifermentans]
MGNGNPQARETVYADFAWKITNFARIVSDFKQFSLDRKESCKIRMNPGQRKRKRGGFAAWRIQKLSGTDFPKAGPLEGLGQIQWRDGSIKVFGGRVAALFSCMRQAVFMRCCVRRLKSMESGCSKEEWL